MSTYKEVSSLTQNEIFVAKAAESFDYNELLPQKTFVKHRETSQTFDAFWNDVNLFDLTNSLKSIYFNKGLINDIPVQNVLDILKESTILSIAEDDIESDDDDVFGDDNES